MVIDTEAICVWSKMSVHWRNTQNFVNPAALPTADSSSTISLSTTTPATYDASTTPMEYDRLPPCESPRPFHYRLAASSPTSTDLNDSSRPSAFSTPTAHYNDISIPLDPLAPSFYPLFDSTPSYTALHPSTFVHAPVDSITSTSTAMTLSPDLHTSAADEPVPTVGTFCRKNCLSLICMRRPSSRS